MCRGLFLSLPFFFFSLDTEFLSAPLFFFEPSAGVFLGGLAGFFGRLLCLDLQPCAFDLQLPSLLGGQPFPLIRKAALKLLLDKLP